MGFDNTRPDACPPHPDDDYCPTSQSLCGGNLRVQENFAGEETVLPSSRKEDVPDKT
jgi:hypothetical protein